MSKYPGSTLRLLVFLLTFLFVSIESGLGHTSQNRIQIRSTLNFYLGLDAFLGK